MYVCECAGAYVFRCACVRMRNCVYVRVYVCAIAKPCGASALLSGSRAGSPGVPAALELVQVGVAAHLERAFGGDGRRGVDMADLPTLLAVDSGRPAGLDGPAAEGAGLELQGSAPLAELFRLRAQDDLDGG